ncbi:MurR/RpiR family transcriptional regulator [Brevibacillus borstelensis]|uniref:MurR/RpiR family transcriptional regulator n=1 Tax=Brevibacillus borstelensis TaxID=45462 RepID=UPI0030C024F4
MNREPSYKEKIRVQYGKLTASQKILARFVLERADMIAMHSARKVADMTQMSEATVIRFCYALGYSGYTQLQEEIRKSLIPADYQRGPVEHYRDATGGQIHSENFVQFTLEAQHKAISQTEASLSEESCRTAVDMILRASKIMVVGYMWNQIPAKWFSSALNTIKGNTSMYTGAMDHADYFIAEQDKDWLVIVISFPRHSREVVRLVKTVKEMGAKIMAITDGELSPVATEADLLVKVQTPQPSMTNGMPIIFSTLNVLLNGIMVMDAERVQKRLRHFDEASGKFYSFAADEDMKEEI